MGPELLQGTGSSNQNPWDQRRKAKPRETDKAYAAFLAYRDGGAERSLRRVGEGLGKSGALIERWSAAHHWVERVAAWDQSLQPLKDAEAREAALAERREALEWTRRRGRAAREMVDLMYERAAEILRLPISTKEVVETYPDGRTRTVVLKACDPALLNAGSNLVRKADDAEEHLLTKVLMVGDLEPHEAPTEAGEVTIVFSDDDETAP